MSKAWDEVHRRYRLRNTVLEDVQRRGPDVVTERWLPSLEEVFGNLDRFLLELQRQWYTELEAKLEFVLDDDPSEDIEAALRTAWRQTEFSQPGMSAVLRSFADHPALLATTGRYRSLQLRSKLNETS